MKCVSNETSINRKVCVGIGMQDAYAHANMCVYIIQNHERMNSVREFYPQNVAHNLSQIKCIHISFHCMLPINGLYKNKSHSNTEKRSGAQPGSSFLCSFFFLLLCFLCSFSIMNIVYKWAPIQKLFCPQRITFIYMINGRVK